MSGRRPFYELTTHFTAADWEWIDARVAEALAAMEPAQPAESPPSPAGPAAPAEDAVEDAAGQ